VSTPNPRAAAVLPVGDWTQPRPIDESYWVVPGRLLVGAFPGSRSRANAMDKLRRFLEAGVTCFIDLTESTETAAYEQLLPFETPRGRRIEYLREPILDHGVPDARETMARVLAMLNGALESGHVVYLHCRAGIGRSAMVAGCWLAERAGDGEVALRQLRDLWQQAAQSQHYPVVPETSEQTEFVRTWRRAPPVAAAVAAAPVPDQTNAIAPPSAIGERIRGAWLGLAVGDALGDARRRGASDDDALVWTQHTALTLALAESLLATGRCDARDQVERYVRWFRNGEFAARSGPQDASATPDVAKAIATYLWRGLPMAGAHDPKDVSATSLPRVLAPVVVAYANPAAAIAWAAECARTTHQSPTILEACRLYGATLVCGLQGQPVAQWLEKLPEPGASAWGKPLRSDVAASAVVRDVRGATPPGNADSVLHRLAQARRIVLRSVDFTDAVDTACREGRQDAALLASLVGTLAGLRFGIAEGIDRYVPRLEQAQAVIATADRCVITNGAAGVPA
jgi:ADP-ribosylglycohydrolase